MISEWEIRLNAAKLGVDRAKYGAFSIPTFEAIHLFERYLRGEDALVLANELEDLTTFIKERSELLVQHSQFSGKAQATNSLDYQLASVEEKERFRQIEEDERAGRIPVYPPLKKKWWQI